MEDNQKLRILRNIEKIHNKSNDCKLDPVIFTELDEYLSILSEYFQITKSEAFFTSIIFSKTCHGRPADLEDIFEHLGCGAVKILEYSEEFENLYSKGLILRMKNDRHHIHTDVDYYYYINPKITDAILQGKPVSEMDQVTFSDIILLLEKLESLLEQRSEKYIVTANMFGIASQIIKSSADLLLIREIKNLKLRFSDEFIFLYLIWKAILGYNTIDVQRLTEMVFDTTSKRINYAQGLLFETNSLIKNSLVEVCEAGFYNDTNLKLTEKTHNLLKKCGLKALNMTQKKDNVFKPDDITSKTLIYDEHEMRQYHLVRNLLQENNLTVTQKRLIDKGLPKGITVLFHGYPGTGKTESVLQLAKETDRMIMRVDISQSKSMWFGESEKRIKRIFTDYTMFMEDCDQTPILFLNEADALISKRNDVNSSNVKQTENSMQNILLEEMENFQGILIATTNLIKNFDAAFERRFLFKVEFRKPSVSIKAKIWKLKLPMLSETDCELLASMFDFSGGQIDNVVRKTEIHEIIHGGSVDIKTIIGFCEEETWEVGKIKIGYLKN